MIEELLFDVSEALRIPVLVLALLALAVVVAEAGALLVELRRRRHRSLAGLERAVEECRGRLAAGMQVEAVLALMPYAWNRQMEDAFAAVVEQAGRPHSEARVAKRLAEYDYLSLRRLERTRILVRMGPALGLMGTLIPLSPALAGLADGDVAILTDNLRVAFSVTVAGLMVGAVAFAIALVRDRLYAQDYSDVEYVAATILDSEPYNHPPAADALATERAFRG
ncbi:MAG: MotA/TolQ/ExbB proton channel family protein [Solirubrobacterales bacterium]